MTTIYMVASNTIDAGNEKILGFYPTRELATARVKAVESNYDFTGDAENDFSAFVIPVDVTEVGADTVLSLR